MEQHVERMLNEHVELCKKIGKLGYFISRNPIFDNLSKDEQYDLLLQHKAMAMYRDVLRHRIDRAMENSNKPWRPSTALAKAQKPLVSAVHFYKNTYKNTYNNENDKD